MFLVFGLNMFFHFLPMTPPSGMAGAFLGILFSSHFIFFVAAVQVIGGVLLLVNQFVPLALALLAPVIANILVFHLTMQPAGLPPGVLATILWLILAWRLRAYFAPLLVQKAVEK